MARARGEDGHLMRKNAREKIRPEVWHGESQVWQVNEGRSNEV